MKNNSNEKKHLSKKSMIYRLLFIAAYIIILYFLYLYLINSGIQHFIIILILVFLVLIVIGPLITGISKEMYYRLFSQKKEREKSQYQIYKEELKTTHQHAELQHPDTKNISLNFKYKKPIIRKCNNCGIIIPNFVKKCPNCGKSILD